MVKPFFPGTLRWCSICVWTRHCGQNCTYLQAPSRGGGGCYPKLFRNWIRGKGSTLIQLPIASPHHHHHHKKALVVLVVPVDLAWCRSVLARRLRLLRVKNFTHNLLFVCLLGFLWTLFIELFYSQPWVCLLFVSWVHFKSYIFFPVVSSWNH